MNENQNENQLEVQINDFEFLDVSEQIKKSIREMGFTKMTKIQKQTIPLLLDGQDVIGQSQTGTGKTAAFAIPILEKIDPVIKRPQALVLCPTRELAVQVANEFKKMMKFTFNMRAVAVYGGEPIYRQITQLKKGAQIIIGTPGRTIDHIKRGTIKTENINSMVLDEADEMLKMGFREDIEKVLSSIDDDRQTVLFSATMPQSIIDITNNYQKDPKLVQVTPENIAAKTVKQQFIDVHRNDRIEAISRVIEVSKPKRCIIFCNKKSTVNDVTDELIFRNFLSDKIHGDLKQEMRMDVLKKFNDGLLSVLVATDVAARGLDIKNVDLVINYDTPDNPDYYVHRIGRSGRAGREGRAITIISGSTDRRLLKDIERYTGKAVDKLRIPTSVEVKESKISEFVKEINEVIKDGDLHHYMAVLNEIDTVYSIEEIAAALIKMAIYSKKDEDYKNDINYKIKEEKGGGSRGRERGRSKRDKRKDRDRNKQRLFLTVGNKDKVNAASILKFVAKEGKIKGKQIGSIDIFDKFSFIDVEKEYAKKVVKNVSGKKLNGRKVKIEMAKNKK